MNMILFKEGIIKLVLAGVASFATYSLTLYFGYREPAQIPVLTIAGFVFGYISILFIKSYYSNDQ